MKSPLIIISIIVTVLLIVSGIGYFILTSPSSTESPIPPRESNSHTEQPPLSFEQKIEILEKSIADVCATGVSQEVTLVFTETEANNLASKLLATAEIPEDIPLEIEGVRIDFQADNIVITEVRAATLGFKVTIKLKAKVGIEEGKPKVEIHDVSFGFVPLPEPLKDRIVAFITQEIDGLWSQIAEGEMGCDGKIGLEFTNINMQQNEVTITVVIKPKA